METLRETISGSAQRKRHKRRCQGAAAIHEQITNGVGHGVLADEVPLEDLPLGADGVNTEVYSAMALPERTAPCRATRR